MSFQSVAFRCNLKSASSSHMFHALFLFVDATNWKKFFEIVRNRTMEGEGPSGESRNNGHSRTNLLVA